MRTWRGCAVVVLGCTCLLTACGGKSSSTKTTSGSSGPPPTAAAATAAANAINLKASDLPGSTASPNSNSPGPLDSQLASCAGTSAPSTSIVNLNSPTLTVGTGLGQLNYSSNVEVKPSQSVVRQDLTAIKGPKGLSCIQTLIPKAIAEGGTGQVKFGKAKLAPLATPTPAAADGSFAYRLTLPATAAGQSYSFVIDFVGIEVGRIEMRLSDFGIGHPVPSADEQRLAALLASRAAANKL